MLSYRWPDHFSGPCYGFEDCPLELASVQTNKLHKGLPPRSCYGFPYYYVHIDHDTPVLDPCFSVHPITILSCDLPYVIMWSPPYCHVIFTGSHPLGTTLVETTQPLSIMWGTILPHLFLHTLLQTRNNLLIIVNVYNIVLSWNAKSLFIVLKLLCFVCKIIIIFLSFNLYCKQVVCLVHLIL